MIYLTDPEGRRVDLDGIMTPAAARSLIPFLARGVRLWHVVEIEPLAEGEQPPALAPAPASEGAIVAELRSKDGITLAALAAALNAPRPVVHEVIMRLQRRNLVTCTGKGKGAKWKAAPVAVEGGEKGEV